MGSNTRILVIRVSKSKKKKDKVHGTPWGKRLVPKVSELEAMGYYHTLKTVGKRHNFDYPHSAQVCCLSLALFNSLKRFHGLGKKERKLLMVAALLHDIGAHKKKVGPVRARPGHEHPHHHKRSQRLILKEGIEGLTDREVSIVACVARYHTSAAPHKRHSHYGGLDHDARRIVRKLASILRIADSLDRRHASMVQDMRCQLSDHGKVLTIWVFCKKHAFDWRPKHRIGLFEKEFDVKVRIQVLFGTSIG